MKTGTKIKICAAAALLLVAIFLPEVVSAGWHAVHGRSVYYRGWKVDVPFEWYAVSHGEGMSVERMTRLSWEKPPEAEFLPVHFTKTYPFSYEVYGKVQAHTLQMRGYLFESQRDMEIAGRRGMCWTFTKWHHVDQLWIACIVPKDLTSADYIGNRAYAPEFFSLLSKTQADPAGKN